MEKGWLGVKMENQTKVNLTFAGIIALLLSSLGYQYIDQEQEWQFIGVEGKQATHYCLERKALSNCVDLSSTKKTCYTLPERTRGKRCTSLWQEIPFPELEVSQEIKAVKKWRCDPINCTPLVTI